MMYIIQLLNLKSANYRHSMRPPVTAEFIRDLDIDYLGEN